MYLSVCLKSYLRNHICNFTDRIFDAFCQLPMAVSRYIFVDDAICFVLPVLWIPGQVTPHSGECTCPSHAGSIRYSRRRRHRKGWQISHRQSVQKYLSSPLFRHLIIVLRTSYNGRNDVRSGALFDVYDCLVWTDEGEHTLAIRRQMVKTGQFTVNCNDDRVMVQKRQISVWWDCTRSQNRGHCVGYTMAWQVKDVHVVLYR